MDRSLDDARENLAQVTNPSYSEAGHRSAQLSVTERPHLRARGLTESAASRPNVVPGESFKLAPPPRKSQPVPRSAPVSPRVVIRRASQPLLASPPSGPLPLPPVLDKPFDDPDSEIFTGSAESGSSFALGSSPLFYNRRINSQDWSPKNREDLPEDAIQFATFNDGDSDLELPVDVYKATSRSRTRTVKKALSQQSLRRPHAPPTTPAPSPATPTPPLTPSSEKSVKKQRSFHHPKVPLPPIPTGLWNPTSPATSSQSPEFAVDSKEHKRASALSGSSRKRLFSTSALRRPSTPSSNLNASIEDDNRSLFSLKSESEHRGVAVSVRSVLHEETGPTDRPSTSSGQEYKPQHILSPADMYIIEASMSSSTLPPPPDPTECEGTRRRGLSSASIRTANTDDGNSSTLSPGNASIRSHRSGPTRARTPSMRSSTSAHLSRHQTRPSQSLEDLLDRAPSPQPPMVSLPPPPRPKRGPTSSFSSTSSTSISGVDQAMPLAPPPPRRGAPGHPSSIEKALHRRSIMRKPSFLEIDDTDIEDDGSEDDDDLQELGSATHVRQFQQRINDGTVSSSFLDLARESFDTIR